MGRRGTRATKPRPMTFEQLCRAFDCSEEESGKLWTRLCLLRLEQAIRREYELRIRFIRLPC
jgi:hypothetical protein